MSKLLSDPPPRQILPPDRIDHVAEALLALAREVWVLTDRIMVTEQVLAEEGIDVRSKIDSYAPDAATQARLDMMREKLLGSVLAALRADV